MKVRTEMVEEETMENAIYETIGLEDFRKRRNWRIKLGTIRFWTVCKQKELLMGLRVKENKARVWGRAMNLHIYFIPHKRL